MVDLGSAKKVSQASHERVPFPAIVGQETLKEALLAVGANDDLDGLLIRGEKGTAKSTATRALTDLLPTQQAIADCPYGCPPERPTDQCETCRKRSNPPVETRPVPFVTLPLGASRERVVGSLSVADALDGDAEFNPGLLARANRGFLYVDEVNLLDDHLVDVLLDAAASGVNRVERDGMSVTHPANFTLVGTMNPEEGDLRPQFRDRFALQVEVRGSDDLDDRVTVIERALSGFDGDFATDTVAARERLQGARERLTDVSLPDSLTRDIAELCRDAGVEGHRADIATARTARTLAALDGRERVIEPDLRRAAELALPHRLQSHPFEDAPDPEDVIDDHFENGSDEGDEGDRDAGEGSKSAQDSASDGGDDSNEGDAGGDTRPESKETGEGDTDDEGGSKNQRETPTPAGAEGDGGKPDSRRENGSDPDSSDPEPSEVDETDDSDFGEGDEDATPLVPGQARADTVTPGAGVAPDIDAPDAAHADGTDGRARAQPSTNGRGARVRTERASPSDSIDAAASVRAAAARGSDRVESQDLRNSVREGTGSTLVVFAMDASASMRGPMRAAKGVALDLLRDAYECRDEVAVVTFAGENADVVLPPTDSVDLAARHLKSLPTGDRTPLSEGLRTADEVLARADPDEAVVVVVTDGRANGGNESPTAATRRATTALAERGAHVLVVDASDGEQRNLISDIVTAADGERIPLTALTSDRIAGELQQAVGGEK